MLVFGVLSVKDCKPFVNRATVVGLRRSSGQGRAAGPSAQLGTGKAVIADEIHLLPIGDQTAGDDPKLPRLLFMGDSISGNYGRGLKGALKGKVNCHHPPTNCGPSGKGVGNVVSWLGAHEVKGRQWDVISFNFGHWDAGNTKAKYQENLEFVIGRLEATGAKLIWVSTCPVPSGCEKAGELGKAGKAPGRKAGVMGKYLNPWALEVVRKHPKIAICDQWRFVKDNEGGEYTAWWGGKNVHFGAKGASELGRLLARDVLKALGRDPKSINPAE